MQLCPHPKNKEQVLISLENYVLFFERPFLLNAVIRTYNLL